MERFKQRKIALTDESSTGQLKVSKLFSLLEKHPYKNQIENAFKINDIKDEIVSIDYIDIVYNKIKFLNEKFERFSILAQNKHIVIKESTAPVLDLQDHLPLIFNFKEYVEIDEVGTDLNAYSIYNAKNTFFDTYDMAKYANRLYKDGLGELAYRNIHYFKDLAEKNPNFNRHKSYRLVKNGDELFVRGITSTGKYFEYGVDFAFVVTMLLLHKDMKKNEGNNYEIATVALSESKLELIISEKYLKDAGEFGKVSSALVVSTNDLGEGSLNFTKIIKVGGRFQHGIYLFPKSAEDKSNTLVISHSKKPETVLANLTDVYELLNNTDEYINDLHEIKSITKPEELRTRIANKLDSPRSPFKNIQALTDIFKKRIDNEISNFANLLEMCNKAEELDIDYDLKDKLRYIISDIILSGRK